MAAIGSIIETGVDKLVKLIKERSRISMGDAAKELGVSLTVIEEWSDFLEEEGIVSIEYRLTKPFLVERNLTKAEVTKKAKEFVGKKDVFVRKAEGTLSFLEREASKLKNVKGEFDKLQKEFGVEIGSMKGDIAELEKYQQLKTLFDKQVQQQKTKAQEKIDEMSQKILKEQRKYQELIKEMRKEAVELKKEKVTALTIEESEELLRKKLLSLKSSIDKVQQKIDNEDSAIKNSESHIEKLRNLIGLMKLNLEKEKSSLAPLAKKSQEQQIKIQKLQDRILKKIIEKEKKFEIAKRASEKFQTFFNKKMKVANLIEQVNKDRNALEKELVSLIKKAKSFQLATKSADVGKQMIELEKKFKEVDKKKEIFEQEFKKLNMLVKNKAK